MKLVLKLEVEVEKAESAFIPADVAAYVVDAVESAQGVPYYGFDLKSATVRRIDIVRDEE